MATWFGVQRRPFPLDVVTYAAREQRARETLSNDHIRAFSPVTFTLHGYPAAAETDAAVQRFVDTMQELNDPLRFHERELYTPDEAQTVRRVNEVVLAVTSKAFGRAIRPWMGPLATMKLFRAIQAIAGRAGPEALRVFELGPGSGYLGAMLLLHGHVYWSSDIAQGFYLWQSRLMEAMAQDGFVEGALQETWPYGAGMRAVHVPWWDFATLHRSAPPDVDVIVCDHALGEMHPYALRYFAQLAQIMLARSRVGLLAHTSIGEPRHSSEEAVRLNFDRVGLVRSVHGPLTLYHARERQLAPAILKLAGGIPMFNPSGAAARLTGRDIVPIRPEEAPLSYELYQFLGFDVPRPNPGS